MLSKSPAVVPVSDAVLLLLDVSKSSDVFKFNVSPGVTASTFADHAAVPVDPAAEKFISSFYVSVPVYSSGKIKLWQLMPSSVVSSNAQPDR